MHHSYRSPLKHESIYSLITRCHRHYIHVSKVPPYSTLSFLNKDFWTLPERLLVHFMKRIDTTAWKCAFYIYNFNKQGNQGVIYYLYIILIIRSASGTLQSILLTTQILWCERCNWTSDSANEKHAWMPCGQGMTNTKETLANVSVSLQLKVSNQFVVNLSTALVQL